MKQLCGCVRTRRERGDERVCVKGGGSGFRRLRYYGKHWQGDATHRRPRQACQTSVYARPPWYTRGCILGPYEPEEREEREKSHQAAGATEMNAGALRLAVFGVLRFVLMALMQQDDLL